jgi:CBS domain-containing protein
VDVAAFLGRFPPFDDLPPDRLAALADRAELTRFPAATVIVRQGGDPSPGLYVVRDGTVELWDDGRLLDLLGEGEVFGLSAVIDAGPTATVRAHEDATCYLIPPAIAEELVGTAAGRSFVLGTFGERQRRRRETASLVEASATAAPDRRLRPVGELIRRAPVLADPAVPIAEAAALMTAERVSSVLVRVDDGWGIVTDRDLRSKVVAAGLDPATPVSAIASHPVRTVTATTLAGDAIVRMFAEDVHHFPVQDEGGVLLGVVTETDLVDLGEGTPFALRGRIERAPTVAAVAEAGRELPAVVVELVDASADPVDVGRVVALAIDAMTRRLIELAIRELGDAPVPWAWLALGSAARREQALRTDQDHALAIDADQATAAEVDPYFERLATSVTDGLEAAGIARCPGDVMATHPSLRRSVASWSEAMHTWMQDLSPRGSELSSLVYDYRRVAGPLEVEPVLDAVVRDARARPGFLRGLGRRALDLRPPTGFVRDLVVERHGEHAGRLDVKRGGITIIGNLARVYAVASGVTSKGTVERLRTTAGQPLLSRGVADELVEAFHFLWEVRLRHQAEQVRAGAAPDEFLDPSTLGPVARQGLKEAFRVIARAQRELATAMDLRMP